MPFVRITVDDVEVTTVDTQGRDVVSVQVGGSRIDPDYADLGVIGGTYPDDGTMDHRIWIQQMPLRLGQVIGLTSRKLVSRLQSIVGNPPESCGKPR